MSKRMEILTVTLNAALDKHYRLESFSAQGIYRGAKPVTLPSAKGINAARTMQTLDPTAIVHCTGFVGGWTGKHICHLLEQEGLRHNLLPVPGESRTCMTFTAQEGIHFEILEPGITVDRDAQQKLLAVVEGHAAAAAWVVIAGSPAEGTERDICRELTACARAQGASVLVDVRSPWLETAWLAGPDVSKPNWSEFLSAVGLPPTADQNAVVRAAKTVARDGVGLLLISQGTSGSLAVTENEVLRVSAPQVSTVSPVGCGDAMVGAFVLSQSRGASLKESLQWAAAAAASNAAHLGAGVVDPEETEALAALVQVE